MTELTGVLEPGNLGTPGSFWEAPLPAGLRRAAARWLRRGRTERLGAVRPFPDEQSERDAWFALGRGCCEI